MFHVFVLSGDLMISMEKEWLWGLGMWRWHLSYPRRSTICWEGHTWLGCMDCHPMAWHQPGMMAMAETSLPRAAPYGPSCWCRLTLIRRQVPLLQLLPTHHAPISILIHTSAPTCLSQHLHPQKRALPFHSFTTPFLTLETPVVLATGNCLFCSLGLVSLKRKHHPIWHSLSLTFLHSLQYKASFVAQCGAKSSFQMLAPHIRVLIQVLATRQLV